MAILRNLITAGFTGLFALSISVPAFAALKVGDKAPDFKLQTATNGKPGTFNLKAALKKGPVVVYFYPKVFTGGCSLEARTFADNMPAFQALKVTVIGVSGDAITEVTKFSTADCQGKFPVASDPKAAVAKTYDAKIPGVDMASRVSYLITKDQKIAFTLSDGNGAAHAPALLNAAQKLKK